MFCPEVLHEVGSLVSPFGLRQQLFRRIPLACRRTETLFAGEQIRRLASETTSPRLNPGAEVVIGGHSARWRVSVHQPPTFTVTVLTVLALGAVTLSRPSR